MKKQFYLFLLVLPLFAFVGLHKFYVSVTEMEYKSEKKSVQIITRVFADDFEDVMKARYTKDFYLTKEKEHPESEVYITKYLSQKLGLKINGQEQQINYLGKEYENDMILFYLEIVNVPAVKKVEVQNTLLLGLFPEQKNIVHVKVKERTKSLLLLRGEEKGTVEF